jgi:hypothetical protein
VEQLQHKLYLQCGDIDKVLLNATEAGGTDMLDITSASAEFGIWPEVDIEVFAAVCSGICKHGSRVLKQDCWELILHLGLAFVSGRRRDCTPFDMHMNPEKHSAVGSLP